MTGPALVGGVSLMLAGAILAWVVIGSDSGSLQHRSGNRSDHCAVVAEDGPLAGVSFVSPRGPADATVVDPLQRIRAEWIGLLPYAFVRSNGMLVFDGDRQWWGERVDGVAELIGFARGAGLRVMLKPHLWMGRSNWVGHFAPDSEEGWRNFESGYRAYILGFAELGESLGVEILVIGTELDQTVRERPQFWAQLIQEIRAVYGGKLTYAANWDGYQDIPFWGELDFIGVDAFFPLSTSATPSVDSLEQEWKPVLADLSAMCRRHGAPVLFTEYGYRSIDGGAGEQWELPPEGAPDVAANHQAQVNAYEAFFRSWWHRPWFAGGFLWKWFPDDEEWAGRSNADYTPQHKPVESVIREWYRGPSEVADPHQQGENGGL